MKARYLSLKPLILWMQAERPPHWERHFGRSAPLEVEIGFGNGEFLVRLARNHPEKNFVGVELEWPSVQRGLRRIAQAGVQNVRLLQVDARVAFQRLFPPRSLQRVYSLFPAPWPKERHAKHRLFSRSFLQLLNSRLAEKGEAVIVTDHQPYFLWIIEQSEGCQFDVHTRLVPPAFGTKYERKWREQGQERFYELRLVKAKHLDIPLKEDQTLITHRTDNFDPQNFRPQDQKDEIVVRFKEFLYDPRRNKGMCRVVVVEDELAQHFWIEIVSEGGQWHIRPGKGCSMVPTRGVQKALDVVLQATNQPGHTQPPRE